KSISASDVAPPSADNATDNATHRLPGSEVAVRVPVAPAPTASVATERRPQPAPEATSSAMTVIPPGVVIVASVWLTCDHVFHHTKSCRSAWSPGVTDGAVIVVPVPVAAAASSTVGDPSTATSIAAPSAPARITN